jgi:ribonuclease R
MLPEKLSNGLCSLNPDVDRLAMVCDMQVNARGEIGDYAFYPAVFRSQARLTYTQVAAALYDGRPDAITAELAERLQALDEVFRALLKARGRRGAIDFETTETRLVFNDAGKIETIVAVERNDAHRLIEECMLGANVCASDFLAANEHHALYRIHEGPTPEKLTALREFLKGFGLQLPGGDEPHARDYAKLLEQIKKRPDRQLLQTVLLRSLQQAVYSPENVGHFGLAYEHYTHFTSPIRRYPDLVIHRAIKAVLAGERYSPSDWAELGKHCSITERRADDATRDVEAWLKCFYMQDRVGEEFDATVSGVTSFGIFVGLDGIYVEGLVHISELGTDYFHFDAVRHQLRGERTGRIFRLADRVRVRIARVDLETSRIEFVLA